MKLAEIASRDVPCVAPGMSLREAGLRLRRAHANGAPVVSGGRVVGVLSMADLAGGSPGREDAASGRENAGSRRPDAGAGVRNPVPPPTYYTDYWTGRPEERETGSASASTFGESSGASSAPGVVDDEWWTGHTVAEVMARTILALPPDTDVAVAADYMMGADVARLLVLEDGRLLGVVTAPDMVRAMSGIRRRGRPR